MIVWGQKISLQGQEKLSSTKVIVTMSYLASNFVCFWDYSTNIVAKTTLWDTLPLLYHYGCTARNLLLLPFCKHFAEDVILNILDI